ncbi:MAG: FAD-dependent oxidoreductase, partial [Bacillota bacterium]|nr:FAD-dependent oxidoreductase [Bacillota bacterium]
GTGVCEPGLKNKYAAYYPVGRMDLYVALVSGLIPVTEKCVEIASSCTLCGRCDYQCYFSTEMRPAKVMKALKEYVGDYQKNGGKPAVPAKDGILEEIRSIVGGFWATNDPAITAAYRRDLCPHVEYKTPRYVIMPGSVGEVSSVIKLLNRFEIPFVARGSGASSHGLVFTDGAVLDFKRMNVIEFNEKNWYVKAGPGATEFELQTEAQKRGFRVHTAEPAACVCANLMTSGLLSTFSTAYGIAADNYVDAEFVSLDGSYFKLSDMDSRNLFTFRNEISEREPSAVCVSVSMKLHPVTDDEKGILVPFETFGKALAFANECAARHIGIAIGLLGGEFVSTFLAPTKKLAREIKEVFESKLKMPYLVLLIGDKYALRSVADMGQPFIGEALFKTLYEALPSLNSAAWLDLLGELSDSEPFSYLKLEKFPELAEIALDPSPSLLLRDVDPELRPVFERLYEDPAMTDLVRLSTYRIQSARYCRENPCVALVCYMPPDAELIERMQDEIKKITDKYRLKSEFGFITPFDAGKRCIWEYDIYFDVNDPDEVSRVRQANAEAGALLDLYSEREGTIRQVRYVINQGCCRKENLLYI